MTTMGTNWIQFAIAESIGIPLLLKSLTQLNQVDGRTHPILRVSFYLIAVGAFMIVLSPFSSLQ